jgi:hypothetical protein
MKIVQKFRTLVNKGELLITEPMRQQIKSLDGHHVTVTVTKWHEARSNQQNAYYWGVVLHLLSNELGYTPEELHELLKQKFLTKWILIKDKEYPTALSTQELSTVMFKEYISKIVIWASLECGIIIPEPNETEESW